MGGMGLAILLIRRLGIRRGKAAREISNIANFEALPFSGRLVEGRRTLEGRPARVSLVNERGAALEGRRGSD